MSTPVLQLFFIIYIYTYIRLNLPLLKKGLILHINFAWQIKNSSKFLGNLFAVLETYIQISIVPLIGFSRFPKFCVEKLQPTSF